MDQLRAAVAPADLHEKRSAVVVRSDTRAMYSPRAAPARPVPLVAEGRIVPPPPRLVRRRFRRRWVVPVAVASTSVAAIGGAVWLILTVAEFLAAHLLQVAGGAVLLALLVAGLGQVGACPGIHCPGCRHR